MTPECNRTDSYAVESRVLVLVQRMDRSTRCNVSTGVTDRIPSAGVRMREPFELVRPSICVLPSLLVWLVANTFEFLHWLWRDLPS